MKSRVLLIEDDKNIALSLKTYLENEGFAVTLADSIAMARLKVSMSYEIIVLDWMLPDGQGIDLLKEFRNQGVKIPVIILTARNDLVDKVLGLESGADDYLTKPFEPRELVARIRARTRNGFFQKNSNKYLYGDLELDPELRVVKFKNKLLDLTKLEYELLKLLIEFPGRVFTRETILNKVWGFDNYPTTRTVDNHIVQLRQKTENEIFETVRGVGYRLRQ